MYFVKYGDEYIHDPRIDGDDKLYDLTLDCEENSCGYCDFTIYPSNPMYDKIAERDRNKEIVVLDEDVELFRGFVYELGKEFYLDGHVRCKGQLAYLEETIVRPYSTYNRGYGTVVGNSPATVFEYLIEQHNSQVTTPNKVFKMGINEADSLSKSHIMLTDSDDYPTTIEEISSKFMEESGRKGLLRIRNEEDGRYIDILKEWTDQNSQILDFGVNLTDYTVTEDSSSLATFVVPFGAPLQDTEYVYNNGYVVTGDRVPRSDKTYYLLEDGNYNRCVAITVFASGVTYYEYDPTKDQSTEKLSLKDYGPYSPESGIDRTITPNKDGYAFRNDAIYNVEAVSKYGYIGMSFEDSSITNRQELVNAAIIALAENISPKTTIEIKAVDMHLINPKIKPIRIGEYVRVRSKPHKLDSYFLCTNIALDLNNPENSIYTLGTTFDTLTGQQNKIINRLNSKINASLDAADAIVKIDAKTENTYQVIADLAEDQNGKMTQLRTDIGNETDQKIATAKSEITSNIKGTVDKAFEDYEVGGVNLLKRSQCQLGTISATNNGITVSPMMRGGWFTVSGNLTKQGTQIRIPLWYNGGNKAGSALPKTAGSYTLTVETGSDTSLAPFKSSSSSTESTINILIQCSDGTHYVFYPATNSKKITFKTTGYIYNVAFYIGSSIAANTSISGKFRLMLEHGTKSSGYSANPDDTDYDIAEAYKYATDYISFAENVGLIVGDQRKNGTLNHNSLMNSSGFHVRKGDVIRASYTDTGIRFYNKAGTTTRMLITDSSIQLNDSNGNQKAIFGDDSIKMDGFYVYKSSTDNMRKVRIGQFDTTNNESSYVLVDDDSVDIRSSNQLYSRFSKDGLIVKDTSDTSTSKGNVLELTPSRVVVGSTKKGHTTFDGETITMRSGTATITNNASYVALGKLPDGNNGLRLYSTWAEGTPVAVAYDLYNKSYVQSILGNTKIYNDIVMSFLDNMTIESKNNGTVRIDANKVYIPGDMTVDGNFVNPLIHKNTVNMNAIAPNSESYHVSASTNSTNLPTGVTSGIRDAKSYEGSSTTLMADMFYGWDGRVYYSAGKIGTSSTSKSSYKELPQCVTLFDSTSNTSNSITLSDSASNYSRLTIIYRSNVSAGYNSTDISSPNGKFATLQSSYFSASENMNFYSAQYAISGTSIKVRVNDSGKTISGAASINHSGTVSSSVNANAIYIVKVIGWL